MEDRRERSRAEGKKCNCNFVHKCSPEGHPYELCTKCRRIKLTPVYLKGYDHRPLSFVKCPKGAKAE